MAYLDEFTEQVEGTAPAPAQRYHDIMDNYERILQARGLPARIDEMWRMDEALEHHLGVGIGEFSQEAVDARHRRTGLPLTESDRSSLAGSVAAWMQLAFTLGSMEPFPGTAPDTAPSSPVKDGGE